MTNDTQLQKYKDNVEACKTPKECEAYAKNAIRLGFPDIAELAMIKKGKLQFAEIIKSQTIETPKGVSEKEFADIYNRVYEGLEIYENYRSLEVGRKFRANRIRPMLDRRGILETLDIIAASDKPSAAFDFCQKHNLDTCEKTVLDYPHLFSDKAVAASIKKLAAYHG